MKKFTKRFDLNSLKKFNSQLQSAVAIVGDEVKWGRIGTAMWAAFGLVSVPAVQIFSAVITTGMSIYVDTHEALFNLGMQTTFELEKYESFLEDGKYLLYDIELVVSEMMYQGEVVYIPESISVVSFLLPSGEWVHAS